MPMVAVLVTGERDTHPNFRCTALAHPPIATNWITPEINGLVMLLIKGNMQNRMGTSRWTE